MPVRHVSQAAAIPVRDGRVCLITSRSGRRWVIPKGHIDPGHTPAQTALIEAREEAGLIGVLTGKSIGNYRYEKYGIPHHVIVFVLEVNEQHTDWPERLIRQRDWVPVEIAVERVEEPELRVLLLGLLDATATARSLR